YNTLMNDYELLKTEVANFIHDTKAKLNEQVKELDDNDWQIYLDKHYGRTRLYPADGSQPIKTDDSDNIIDEEGLIKPEDIDKYQEYIPAENFDEDIDNNTDTEVNSDNEKEDTHKILEGDNPTVVETVEDENSNSDSLSRPKIIFPDDYKDHN
ncbi:MAG: DivIVA domain-containing protein, partial [Lactobacillus iners]|nr:DivIVA domain-containing protein [Lactobacillus iners]